MDKKEKNVILIETLSKQKRMRKSKRKDVEGL